MHMMHCGDFPNAHLRPEAVITPILGLRSSARLHESVREPSAKDKEREHNAKELENNHVSAY